METSLDRVTRKKYAATLTAAEPALGGRRRVTSRTRLSPAAPEEYSRSRSYASAADYRPRDARHAVMYRVIDEHLEAFLETARRHADGASLPEFVEQEFRDFLTCGVLAHGFARLQCTDCAVERLVLFSCKGRGFCASSGGRRTTEYAAWLVDEVLPRVPVRQRVLLGFQRHRARRYGIRDGRSGCVRA